MEYEHVQQLTEDFSPQDTLDHRYNTLVEIAEHFRMEYNEDLKRNLEENLREKLKDLIKEFESKLEKLKYTVASLRSSPSYYY